MLAPTGSMQNPDPQHPGREGDRLPPESLIGRGARNLDWGTDGPEIWRCLIFLPANESRDWGCHLGSWSPF